jgi:hypothetical protein
MLRMGFDPDRPLVATSAFQDGTLAAGEVFDWRAKGMQPIDVLVLFQSGLLTHSDSPPSAAPAALPAATAQAAEAAAVSTPIANQRNKRR